METQETFVSLNLWYKPCIAGGVGGGGDVSKASLYLFCYNYSRFCCVIRL